MSQRDFFRGSVVFVEIWNLLWPIFAFGLAFIVVNGQILTKIGRTGPELIIQANLFFAFSTQSVGFFYPKVVNFWIWDQKC